MGARKTYAEVSCMQHGTRIDRSDGVHLYVKVAQSGMHKKRGCPTCARIERENARLARKEAATKTNAA